ncbi:MAG: DUF433 domain-containing protein [Pyrinomonadaceae bacterium]
MNVALEEQLVATLPVNIDPEIMSGTPVFEGTRVPIDALINNLADGVSLDEFLQYLPTVTREQALAIIRFPLETLKMLESAGENPP